MEIPQIDRSNYLKGLLILAKKDCQLTEQEKKIIKHFAKKLGFSSDFYNETIENLLANKYIGEEPIKFSNRKIAKSFLEDGIRLIISDNFPDESEINWMLQTAELNSIEKDWLEQKISDFKSKPRSFPVTEFALYSLI